MVIDIGDSNKWFKRFIKKEIYGPDVVNDRCGPNIELSLFERDIFLLSHFFDQLLI